MAAKLVPRVPPWAVNAIAFVVGVVGMLALMRAEDLPRAFNPGGSSLLRSGGRVANATGAEWPPRRVVDSIADRDGRVIVSAVNCAFVDLADNWAQSLLRLGVTNFLFVPLDAQAQAELLLAYPDRVVPVPPGTEWVPRMAASFGNVEGFKAVTKSRPTILLAFIQAGYTVFYNDADTYWVADAMAEFEDLRERRGGWPFGGFGGGDEGRQPRPHAVIMEDDPKRVTEPGPNYCSGILYLRPTPLVENFLTRWADEIATGQHQNDQPAFNAVLSRMMTSGDQNETDGDGSGLPVRVAGWDRFPSGAEYFKGRAGYMREEHNVAIVHNNWIMGKERKVERFQEHGMWRPGGGLGKYKCGAAQ